MSRTTPVKHNIVRIFLKASAAEGQRRLHKNTAHAPPLGFQPAFLLKWSRRNVNNCHGRCTDSLLVPNIWWRSVRVSSRHPLCSELSNSQQATAKSSSCPKPATPVRSGNFGHSDPTACQPHNIATPTTCCNGPRHPVFFCFKDVFLLAKTSWSLRRITLRFPPHGGSAGSLNAYDRPQLMQAHSSKTRCCFIAAECARRRPYCLATYDSLGRWWSLPT